jgi:hypothetical protein
MPTRFETDGSWFLISHFMAAPKEWSPDLNLKVGEKLFPVKKVRLLEIPGLFQDEPALLAHDYEVRTSVSLSVFEDFMRIIQGKSVPISEENCEPFQALADEFRFDELSKRCARFVESQLSVIKPSTLNLKVGERLFPVKRTRLLEILGLFQDEPALLSHDYEVQTSVSLGLFEDFMRIVQGKSVPISEENCEPFHALAEEFRFPALAAGCARFREWRDSIVGSSTHPGISDRGGLGVGPGHRVTVSFGYRSETFEVLNSLEQIDHFAMVLKQANETNIAIDEVQGNDRIVEKAVAVVYCNALTKLPNSPIKEQFLVLTLWRLHVWFLWNCIDAAIYCLNRLNEIAPAAFDKAKLLLMSQCNPLSPGKYLPLPNADATVIQDAVRMLEKEKNQKREDAKELLCQLKTTPLYTFFEASLIWERSKKRS